MNVLAKRRIMKLISPVFTIFSVCLSLFCLYSKICSLPLTGINDKFNILAARSILPGGNVRSIRKGSIQKSTSSALKEQVNTSYSKNESPHNGTSVSDEKNNDSETEIETPVHSDEKTYKIIESQFGSSGTKFENFYVKNTTDFNLDISSELAKCPAVSIRNTDKPQVLIIHTHTSESYMDKDLGFCYESFYPRSDDNNKNVTQVGQAISRKLSENGICTIHDTTFHDIPTYNGSYSRSFKTIKANLEKYPSIQVVLDIHRDSLGNKESGKIKPTFKHNGRKAAQVMVIAGCDSDGTIGFPEWEKNLRFALRLHQKCETMFPGITRPMFFGKVKYNLNMTRGSVLIEVGSDVNTLDEAIYSGSLVGDALSQLLISLKQ